MCVSLREGEGSIDVKEFFHSLCSFTGFQAAAEEKVSSGSSIYHPFILGFKFWFGVTIQSATQKLSVFVVLMISLSLSLS